METKLKLRAKHFLKSNYFELFTILYIVFIVCWVYFDFEDKLGILVTGIYLSILYFFQKQNLEELKTFKELFVEFNSRYDNLNNKLNKISKKDEGIDDLYKIFPKNKDRDTLDDYFNLCAEEYLFYKKGLIVKEVWTSWCKGMIYHLKNHIIWEYWEEVQKEESYYGLTTEIIINGAKS
ncbi:MAG: hypothetical protein HRU40_13320 [Saprospiraceae bacterium]|nr:hypothetical protein [Saprospiraceae bacterium]